MNNNETNMLVKVRDDYTTIDARTHDMHDVDNLMHATMKLSVLTDTEDFIDHVTSVISGLSELPFVIRTESHNNAIGVTLFYQHNDYELSIECFNDNKMQPMNADLVAIRNISKLNSLLNDCKNGNPHDYQRDNPDYMVDLDFRDYDKFTSVIINDEIKSFHENNALNHHYNDIPDL